MKTIKKLFGIHLLALTLILSAPKITKAQGGNYISDQEFYDDLAPYGTWVSDPQYGNVWIPDAEDNFRPYATQGHWVLTDYGNTWVSDYPWGWATFHYGRWRYDDYYGWEWLPGHEWAPAWVSWRHGGGYYGWAPLLPGISLTISIGRSYHVPDNYWVCAPQAYINRPNIYNYYVPHTRSVTIIRNTTVINNTYVYNNRTYITGPRVEEISRVTHQRPQVYRISNASRPTAGVVIRNNTVNIFRPSVQKAPDARPTRVVDGAAYRQQNPTLAIAHRGDRNGGAPANNHTFAARLAATAKTTTPDNKVVHVNAPTADRGMVRPDKRGEQPQAAKPNEPVKNGAAVQPGQPKPDRGNHNRPAPATQPGQPVVTPNAPATNAAEPQRGGHNRQPQAQPGQQPQPAVQAQKDQAKQAEEAQKNQARQQAEQAAQAQRAQAKQAAQAQKDQARQQAQQAAQAQKDQARQQAQQAAQAQKDQARQQAQQAAQAQKDQARQQAQQAAQAQKDQARQQAQQAAQAQKDQARQQAQQAAQAQKDQARQQAQQAAQAQRDQAKQAAQAQKDQARQQAQQAAQAQRQQQQQAAAQAKQAAQQQRQQQKQQKQRPQPAPPAN